MSGRARRAINGACVVALGTVLALAYGSPYGANNQVTYLLEPLARASSELYHRDWFVAETHHYHVAFSYITAPLYWLDNDGAVAFGIAQLVVMVATFIAIYALVAASTQRFRLTIFAGLAGLLALGGGRALGGTYLYAGYLQPSSLASLAWLVAMVAWMCERRLIAGCALAVGAIFHLNFAVLGIGAFGLAELCARQTSAKRLAHLLVPSLLVVIAFLPMMLASSDTADGDFALHVLTRFIFTIHFWPHRVRYEWLALAGWLAIAWAMRPTFGGPRLVRLRWFAISCLGCSLAAVWLCSIPPLLPLTRLFVWRIAPFGQLAAQLLLVLGVFAIATRQVPWPRGWPLAVLLFGATAVVYNAFRRPRDIYPEVIVVAIAGLVAAVVLRRELIVRALCVVACVFALWFARAGIVSPNLFGSVDSDLATWARTTTPVDSIFLVPPYNDNFRLMARRAVVVDTKSPPMYLDELVAWYRRVCTVVDAPSLANLDDAWTRWDAMAPERRLAIARLFHADYVVLSKGRTAVRIPAPVVYEDASDVVYAVPPHE